MMFKNIVAMAVVMLLHWGISATAQASCALPAPTGLQAKNMTSCSMEMSWKKVNGASYYRVRYKTAGSSSWQYTDPVTTTKVVVANLQPATSYELAVASYCSDSTTAGYSGSVTKSTLSCSKPSGLVVTVLNAYQARASWSVPCSIGQFTLQYRKAGTTSWTTVNGISGTEYVIGNLLPQTAYECRVRSDCSGSFSGYSGIVSFTTTMAPPDARRNILFFFLDDGRYDAYVPTGAPEWINTPSINRIAYEGVNFQIAIPTTSQCAPSRASVYTGLYAHVHKVQINGDTLNKSLPLIQSILQQRGYYTGFIGKFGQKFGDPRGFNWWATNTGSTFIDDTYKINGISQVRTGHISDVYFQLAKEFLATVPENTPFALFYFTRVPHKPTTPRPQDLNLYTSEVMPVPAHFSFYTNNYPSFYESRKTNADSTAIRQLHLETFQCNYGVEAYMDSFFHILQQREALDSSLIIFSSDNGYMMGEHKMEGKIVALEASIRVPLFVRYPPWFAPGTVVSNQIAANIDITTTLLEFAGMPNVYGFQGLSLRELANGTVSRTVLLYEYGGDGAVPPIRAVRTLTDKFIRSYCTSTTEEYYDLINDPGETTNAIFDADKQARIQQLRLLLDSLRQVTNDIEPSTKNCYLVTSSRLASTADGSVGVFPNPTSQFAVIHLGSDEPALIAVHDALGRCWYTETTTGSATLFTGQLPAGVYVLTITRNSHQQSVPLVVQHDE